MVKAVYNRHNVHALRPSSNRQSKPNKVSLIQKQILLTIHPMPDRTG